ncbi:MAG: hypothetical protein ACJ78Q_17630 [Chloroflexia bacterium]
MADPNIPVGSLVISTNRNDYFVIPREALDQFRATPEQRELIDEEARAQVPGTFAPLEASEAAAQPNFASEPEATALAWFHTE